MPHLVPELRFMVLGKHDDVTHLWTTCRLVSTEFKQLVEHIFVTHLLPRTTIFFPCEGMDYDFSDTVFRFTKQPERFHFRHVKDIDGKQKAVFAGGRVGYSETASVDCMARLMQDDALKTMLIKPKHLVGIGKVLSDVHLPGLCVDSKLGTIEFDWKDLMSIWTAEEALCQKFFSQMAWMACIRPC